MGSVARLIIDSLFAVSCPCCAQRGHAPCRSCIAAFRPAEPMALPRGLDDCAAAYSYNEQVRSVVLACKRSRTHVLAEFMASAIFDHAPPIDQQLVQVIERSSVNRLDARAALGWTNQGSDSPTNVRFPALVTWVPTTAQRIRDRGYDHAELIARSLARRCGLPCSPLLRRTSGAVDHRMRQSTQVSFSVDRAWRGDVLVVDDVWTTGQSLSAAAAALRAGGATSVVGRTFAARSLR